MKKTYNYTRKGTNVRWLMSIDGQNVQIFCDGESRTYNIPEKILKTRRNYEYVYIYVEGKKVYQFKFEDDKLIVGDIFDLEGEHLDTFASQVFGED
jgi:hypothetical protein